MKQNRKAESGIRKPPEFTKKGRFLLQLFLTTLTLFSLAWVPYGPEERAVLEISSVDVDYEFGKQITIHARIEPAGEIQQIVLNIQPDNHDVITEPVMLDQGGEFVSSIDMTEKKIAAFSAVFFWYRIVYSGQEEKLSPKYRFDYEDNRFNWQSLSQDNIRVFWSNKDETFGRQVLDVARNGIGKVSEIVPVNTAVPLRIYVYNNAVDLQTALQTGQTSWAVGHANPALGVVLVTVPMGLEQRLELERQIPHEIMHIYQYYQVGPAYERAPVWFLEGLASLVETYPNPEYYSVLNTAVKEENLIPMSSLCQTFPHDSAGAFLAYAQSASFVGYIKQNYGISALNQILLRYADGMGCEEGLAAVTGKTLTQLDRSWQKGGGPGGIISQGWYELAPYLIVFMAMIGAMIIPLLARLHRKKV